MQVFANQMLTKDTAATQSTDSGNTANSSTTSSATITANDFLQLLVTEMQNQDPTTQTDPNEYINQLVQVNSLEQLVQINQDLTSGGTSSSSSGDSIHAAGGASDPAPVAASGNLSAPAPGSAASAALRVGSALGGEKNQTNPVSSSGAGAANSYDAIAAAIRSRRTAASTSTFSPAR